MRTLALGGVAGPAVFAVVVFVSAALRPEYSHVKNFISELGARGTPYAALLNYAGFVPAGLMLAALGVALAGVLPRDRLTIVAAALVTLFGCGVATSGVIWCDPGCPQTGGSLENLVHNTIAPISFLSLIVGAGILGIGFRRFPAWRPLSVYSLLTSAFGLLLLVALANSLEARMLTGLWQRLLLATLFLWCAVIALRAFRCAQLDGPPFLRIEKFANAFVPNAVPSELVIGEALNAVERFGKKHGGLWVGGKVTVTPDGLSFVPNSLNVAFHVGLEEIRIPLLSIRSVRREFGWVTGIVVVEHSSGEFRFRCFGAKQVAAEMSSPVGTPLPFHQ